MTQLHDEQIFHRIILREYPWDSRRAPPWVGKMGWPFRSAPHRCSQGTQPMPPSARSTTGTGTGYSGPARHTGPSLKNENEMYYITRCQFFIIVTFYNQFLENQYHTIIMRPITLLRTFQIVWPNDNSLSDNGSRTRPPRVVPQSSPVAIFLVADDLGDVYAFLTEHLDVVEEGHSRGARADHAHALARHDGREWRDGAEDKIFTET